MYVCGPSMSTCLLSLSARRPCRLHVPQQLEQIIQAEARKREELEQKLNSEIQAMARVSVNQYTVTHTLRPPDVCLFT